ncbi:MAG TPA: RnfABCDGE type electron transport complex subunit D [Gemmatimonadaceae bacterium]|jgi:Na+-translocating ferredoxin:NAD+ oxidoreductase RnfD subunit|nr:RnfABCDGE type electron transport complex subunit D [Gemmatimonadaceae bacterium]
MRASRFFRTPKGLVLVVLGFLAVLAGAREGWPVVMSVGVATVPAMVIDALILYRTKKRWAFPSGALLTGLIVAMILNSHSAWYVVAVTSIVGVLSKYIVRGHTANVFNPAAIALVATFYLFNPAQNWWGALPGLPTAALIVLLVTGMFITYKVNKIPAVLAFLGVYYLCATTATFVGNPERFVDLYRAPDVHAALYFAFFMVTDPPTSPPKHRDQVIFGAITATAAFAAFDLIGAAYFLLAGLLVANVWEGWRRRREHRSRIGAGR